MNFARGFGVGILCVIMPPVGITVAVWMLLRSPGEVPPVPSETLGAPDVPPRRRRVPRPARDWSKPEAYADVSEN